MPYQVNLQPWGKTSTVLTEWGDWSRLRCASWSAPSSAITYVIWSASSPRSTSRWVRPLGWRRGLRPGRSRRHFEVLSSRPFAVLSTQDLQSKLKPPRYFSPAFMKRRFLRTSICFRIVEGGRDSCLKLSLRWTSLWDWLFRSDSIGQFNSPTPSLRMTSKLPVYNHHIFRNLLHKSIMCI